MIFLSRFFGLGFGLKPVQPQILGWVVVVLAISICAEYNFVRSSPVSLRGGVAGCFYAMVHAIADGTCVSTLNIPPENRFPRVNDSTPARPDGWCGLENWHPKMRISKAVSMKKPQFRRDIQ
jgi:hypothetical protein